MTFPPAFRKSATSPLSGASEIDPLSGQWTAFKGNSVHQAVVALVVVERMVPSAAIVPNSHRAWAPLKATDEPILRRMLIKISEQSQAFFARPADNAGCEGRIDVQHGLAAAGVGDDDRMDRLGCIRETAQRRLVGLDVVTSFAKSVGRCVMGLERSQGGLEALG